MNREQNKGAFAGEGSFRSCAAGFLLAIILTGASFALVMSGAAPRNVVLLGVSAAAVLQILVHLHFFLHLGASSTARWNMPVLAFTLLVMVLFIGGTFWIMYHLHYRLM